MKKVFIVASREFKAAVMTKAFLVSLIMMPILMGGSILVQYLTKDVKSLKDKTFVIIDRTPGGTLSTVLEQSMSYRNENLIFDKDDKTKQKQPKFIVKKASPSESTPEAKLKQRMELADQVRNKDIYGFLDIGENVLKTPSLDQNYHIAHAITEAANVADMGKELDKVKATQLSDDLVTRYYSNSPTYNEFWTMSKEVMNRIIPTIRAEKDKLDPIKLMSIMKTVPLTSKTLPRINKLTGQMEDGKDVNILISFFVPFGIVMIMFMVIMVGATPLMQGVVEEKMQRISEVLLSAAKPFELMLGKLLGGVGVSLLLGSVYLAGVYIAAWQYNFLEYITPTVIIWFLVYLVLAVFMFGSLFVAVGAACTDLKETQSLLTPVMLIVTSPLFFISNLITEPDGALATGLSFFPFATPTIMTTRLAIPPGAPWWRGRRGRLHRDATTLLCVWIASRIFRVGLLMQGKGASFGELVKWVMKG
jgi:ABC-2 type transport system permease protein